VHPHLSGAGNFHPSLILSCFHANDCKVQPESNSRDDW
jgi:hypothetical protein